MKTFRVCYQFHNRGSLLVKANTKEDVLSELDKYSLDDMLNACNEGEGPFICEDCDIEEVKNIM
jgi:hypothetical protein